MTDGLGALLVMIDFDGVPPDEWADWYDTEHVPQRIGMPGWLTGARWMAADGSSTSLGAYDLESLAAMENGPYKALRDAGDTPWTKRMHRLRDAPNRPSHRYECVQVEPGDAVAPDNADYLLLVRMDVDPAFETQVDSWYDEEHLPLLRAVPGVLCARRFVVRNADDRLEQKLATYHLTSPEVVRTEQWRAAARTERAMSIASGLSKVSFTMFAKPGLEAASVSV